MSPNTLMLIFLHLNYITLFYATWYEPNTNKSVISAMTNFCNELPTRGSFP